MPKIPSVIKLKNGEDFNVSEHEGLAEALNSVLTQAVKVEKDKLYGTIEEYRKQVNPLVETLNRVAPVLSNLSKNNPQGFVTQQDIAAARQASQEVNNMITSDNVNSNPSSAPTAKGLKSSPVEQAAQKVSSEEASAHFANLFKGILSDALGPIVSKIESLEKKEINDYIEKVRKENEGQAILELVSGNTLDEVNTSLANAKEMYKKYFPQGSGATQTAQGNNSPSTQAPAQPAQPATQGVPATAQQPSPNPTAQAPATPTQAPAPPTVTLPGTNTPTEANKAADYAKMSMDQFSKVRDAEFEKLKSMYQN